MNILIFGATNNTCYQLVKQALQDGHYVTVFIPHGSTFDLLPSLNLGVISGDILNHTTVDEVMQGQEIVIDALDATAPMPSSFYSESACNIIKAMNANKVTRLIYLSKIGADNSIHQGPILYRLLIRLLSKVSTKALLNVTVHETFIRRSDVHWTIVRTVLTTDNTKSNNHLDIIRSRNLQLRKPYISHKAVANFLLTIAINQTYINEIIGISGK